MVNISWGLNSSEGMLNIAQALKGYSRHAVVQGIKAIVTTQHLQALKGYSRHTVVQGIKAI